MTLAAFFLGGAAALTLLALIYCACKVGGAADRRAREAIDADFSEVPSEKPGVGLWV